MSAVVYCRISQGKGDKGLPQLSLLSQQELCENYCKNTGLEVSKIITEIGSARDIANLPKLKSLIETIKNDQTIIISDVSRFLRNIMQALNLIDILMKKNVSVYSVSNGYMFSNNSTITDKFYFRSLLNQAEYESDTIALRVNRSLNYRRANGALLGKPKFGQEAYYDENNIRRSRENTTEQIIKKTINKMKKQGYDIEDIADTLNAEGYTFRGKEWTVRRVNYVNK